MFPRAHNLMERKLGVLTSHSGAKDESAHHHVILILNLLGAGGMSRKQASQ